MRCKSLEYGDLDTQVGVAEEEISKELLYWLVERFEIEKLQDVELDNIWELFKQHYYSEGTEKVSMKEINRRNNDRFPEFVDSIEKTIEVKKPNSEVVKNETQV